MRERCYNDVDGRSTTGLRRAARLLTLRQDPIRHLTHRHPMIHRRPLNPLERLRLGHLVLRHQLALGPLHRLTRLQTIRQTRDLRLQRRDLRIPRQGDLDRRHQVRLLERLHQVRHRTGRPRPLHQITLAERSQNHDRSDAPAGDPLRRRQAVHDRHLDIEDDQVRAQILGQTNGSLAVAGLTDDVVALFDEHLGQVQPDEGLVLGDQHPLALGTCLRVGHGTPTLNTPEVATPRHVGTADLSVVGRLSQAHRGVTNLRPTEQGWPLYSNRQRRWSQTPYSVGSNPTGGTKTVIPIRKNSGVHPPHLREEALRLHAAGVPFGEIYRRLGLSRNTVGGWLYDRRAANIKIDRRCPHCDRPRRKIDDPPSYAYLLGQYLGDGHLLMK